VTSIEIPTGWPRSVPFPKGWSAPLISEVAHRESGHTPDKDVAEYWKGSIKWLSLTDCERLNRIYIHDTIKTISQAGIDNSSARLLPAGVVVLSRDAGVGQSAITTTSMAVSQHFVAWKCSERLNSKFLYYWLQYLRPELERIAVGSTIKTIGMKYFDRLRIPLPPILMQSAIAKALEACDSVNYALENLVEKKKRFRDGLARKLLTGEIRFPEFSSDTWQWSRLEQHIQRVSRRNTNGVTRVLTASGEHGLVDQRQYFKRNVAGADLSKYYLLRRGEFAYNRSAMKGYPYGATKRLNKHEEGALSTLYLCFSVNDQQIDSDFLLHAFERGVLNRQLRPIVRIGARAHGLLNVGEEDYFSISVPFPSLLEQRRIAKVLNNLNREIDLLQDQRVQMIALKDGLFSFCWEARSALAHDSNT
jgi:type I restriction enzyme S subunit